MPQVIEWVNLHYHWLDSGVIQEYDWKVILMRYLPHPLTLQLIYISIYHLGLNRKDIFLSKSKALCKNLTSKIRRS